MTTLEKLEELIYIGFKETDKKWQETDKKWQETDRKWQETDRKLQESDTRFKAWLEESFRKTEAMLQQLSRETEKKIGELTGKWGHFVEGLIAPGAVRLFQERGIQVTGVAQRVKRQKDGETMEIDVLVTNGNDVVLIEAKSTLSVDDVKNHIERLRTFPHFFPEYQTYHVFGAVAGIVIDEGADKFAYRQGIFVMAQRGDAVKILNDEKFKPKIWSSAI